MQTKYSILMLMAFTAVVVLPPYSKAQAQVDGICVVGSPEDTSYSCGNFNGNVIEFVGATAASCTFSTGTTPCTRYTYRYTGVTNNQIVVAIPKAVMTKSVNALDAGCDQLYVNGEGDPTTGFGKNQLTFNVCRITPNLGSSTEFTLSVDPSSAAPLSWQEKIGNKVYADTVLGPSTPGAAVASTGETLTAANGTTLTYRIVGGNVEILSCKLPDGVTDCPLARVLTLGQTALCFENAGSPYEIPLGSGKKFSCEAVTFVDGNPNFKAGENSTCYKYIGGRPVAYSC